MSANTAIKEGGNPHSFGLVDYLRVASGSDQYALWVPESERQLTTKSITKNGIYRASDDGVYGWSSVSVNVPAPDSVTGKDDDGDEVVVKPDPDTGVLEEEKVPSSIEITTPPTKLVYADGEAIDLTGIVVKAYFASGEEYGEVPASELILQTTTANYDESEYGPIMGDEYIFVAGYSTFVQLPYGFTCYNSGVRVGTYNGKPIYWAAREQNAPGVFFTSLPNGKVYYKISNGVWRYNGIWEDNNYSEGWSYYTYELHAQNDWSLLLQSGEIDHVPVVNTLPDPSTLVDGKRQTIPVQWLRPGDGAVLETSFAITVIISGGHGED